MLGNERSQNSRNERGQNSRYERGENQSSAHWINNVVKWLLSVAGAAIVGAVITAFFTTNSTVTGFFKSDQEKNRG